MVRQDIKRQAILEATIEQMGYECVGIEQTRAGRHSVLRIYIDKPEGILVEDCAAVSHQVSGVLDVEALMTGEYELEVSSPGLDRPLFKFRDYARFVGREVKIRLTVPLSGRRNFAGFIKSAANENVVLEADGNEFELKFEHIEKAKLVPIFE